MSEIARFNDRFPIDPHTLMLVIAACAALSLLIPAARVQSFTELLGVAITLLQGRR